MKNHFLPYRGVVEKFNLFVLAVNLVVKAYKVRFDFTGCLIIETEYLFDTGICNLRRIVAEFYFRYKIAVFIAFCRQLIYAAERRTIIGCNKLCTYSPVCLLYTSIK